MDQRLQYEHIMAQKKVPEGKLYLFHLLIKLISIRNKNNLFADRIRYLTMTDASMVWMPVTFFRNEKIGSFQTMLKPNLYIRIFPDGSIPYSIRWVIIEKIRKIIVSSNI